jgi:hypothetical protein
VSPPPDSASRTCQLAVILNSIQDRLVLRQCSNYPQPEHPLSPENHLQVRGTDPESVRDYGGLKPGRIGRLERLDTSAPY